MRLISLPVSHFCEKARFALQVNGVAFVEEPHVPLAHKVSTGGGSTPYLIKEDGTSIGESTEIMEFAFGKELTAEERALDGEFSKLGYATRVVAYNHVLERPALAIDLLAPVDRVPWPERFALDWGGFYVLRQLMRSGLNINDANAARSMDKIRAVCADVEARLADGRSYLAGEEFGMLDISFCALLAPLVAPPELELYGRMYEAVGEEEELKRLVDEMRTTPAGQFVLRVYREKRNTRL